MIEGDSRALLLRVLFDEEFYNLLLAKPEVAISSYSLDEEEKTILIEQDERIYSLIRPVDEATSGIPKGPPPAPPGGPTTVVVVFFIIVAFALDNPLQDFPMIDQEKVKKLVGNISQTFGKKRFETIMKLITELSPGYVWHE